MFDGMTREDLIAALVDHSIGYLDYTTASNHIRDWEAGRLHCYCEGCIYSFKSDLNARIQSAISYWNMLPEERKNYLRALVDKMPKDTEGAMTFGAMYPTMVL